MEYAEFSRLWQAMTDAERQPIRDKAKWEHVSLMGVLADWPSLIPERLRPKISADTARRLRDA